MHTSDKIAATSLVIALASSIFVFWDRVFERPKVRFIPPERVVLYQFKRQNGQIVVRVAAQMSYYNIARGEHAGILKVEEATVDVDGRTTKQRWNNFGRLRRNSSGYIAPEYGDDAGPLAIPSQTAVSHFTIFSPLSRICAVGDAPCAKEAEASTPGFIYGAMLNGAEIDVRFVATLIDGRTLAAHCSVQASQNVKSQIRLTGGLVADCGSTGVGG